LAKISQRTGLVHQPDFAQHLSNIQLLSVLNHIFYNQPILAHLIIEIQHHLMLILSFHLIQPVQLYQALQNFKSFAIAL